MLGRRGVGAAVGKVGQRHANRFDGSVAGLAIGEESTHAFAPSEHLMAADVKQARAGERVAMRLDLFKSSRFQKVTSFLTRSPLLVFKGRVALATN